MKERSRDKIKGRGSMMERRKDRGIEKGTKNKNKKGKKNGK